MFITHKGKVMKNKRNQKNIIWKILLIVFSIVLIICLIIIGIQKYQQKSKGVLRSFTGKCRQSTAGD